MNKLLALLESLVGKELTAEQLKEAKSLAEKVIAKLNGKDDEIKKLGDKLAPFEKAEADSELKKAFIEAGGHESQFDKAKRNGLNAENVKDKLADFPSLTKEAPKEPNLGGINITGGNPTGGEKDDEPSTEGSLIVRPGMGTPTTE